MHGEVSLVLLVLSEILSKNAANYCGQDIYSGTNGTIKTNPAFNKNNSCLWTVHPPPNRITTIRILQAGLDKCLPEYSCCLSVIDEDSNRNYVHLCNEAPKKPVTLSISGNKVLIFLEASQKVEAWIDFFTRENSECQYSDFQCYDKTGCYNSTDNCIGDFTCPDHSDKVDCGKCPINLTLCNLKSKKCFDPVSQRCDGTLHCPKGEDELSCSSMCPNMIKCPKDKKCIKQDQICDSKVDCSDGFDESNCAKEDDSSGILFSLIFIITSLCAISFVCIVFQWVSTRRGTQRFLNNPPEFPLAPFEGPGGQEHESSSSEIFTDSEFRQGGGIYESYLQATKKFKPIKADLSSTTKSYMDLDGDNELIVLASLNVPVDMCVGLTLTDEKLNLPEVLTKERLQSVSRMNVTVNQCVSGESSQSTEIRCIDETSQKTSSRSSERISERTFIVSNSSEWTDIEDISETSSRIIYVKSAKHV